MGTVLSDAFERFKSNDVTLFREEPNLPLLRLAYDRMVDLKGVRGIDDWREFLGLLGFTYSRALDRNPRTEGIDADDYWKAATLAGWYFGWLRSSNRAQRKRDAGVPGEPRPTVAALIERDGVKCWRCGRDCDLGPEEGFLSVDPETGRGIERNPRYRTVGHVIQLSQGGKDTMDNAKLECWDCNTADGMPILGGIW